MCSNVYEQYLLNFRFTEGEIKEILPFWLKACRLLELSEEDLRFSMEEWLPAYWDLSLEGVRKCIGAYLREFIRVFRMEEYKKEGAKILYCNLPVHIPCVYANKIAGGERIHICQPDFILVSVLQAFFNKTDFLPGAGTFSMGNNCWHCGKNRIGMEAQCKGMVASPTVTWDWGLFCNEGLKTEEYMERLDFESKRNYVISTIPHDMKFGIRESDNKRRVQYLADRLRIAQKEISEYTGIVVTEDDIREAEAQYFAYIDKFENLMTLIYHADPQPVSCNNFTLFESMQNTPFDTGWEYLTDALEVLTEEIRQRVQKKEGVLPKGAPKFACHFTPYCVPWLDRAFTDQGINIAYNLFFPTASSLKRFRSDRDIYRMLAKQWLITPGAVNIGDEANIVTEILEEKPVDGVLSGFFSFECWLGSLHKAVNQIVEENTGIIHYYLEGNFWNDAQYTREERLSRIQNISYHIRIRKMVEADYGKE